MKVDLYEVCLSYIIYCLLFYIRNIPTPLFFAIFVLFLTTRARSSGSIVHKGLIQKVKGIRLMGEVKVVN